MKEFDLKTQAWWIHTPTREISEAAQEWLFSQGVYWVSNNTKDSEVKATRSKILTNLKYLSVSDFVKGEFMHDSGPINMVWYPPELEIKLTFKTVVDQVIYPELAPEETEAQKELRTLQEQISKLQEQANKIQKAMEEEK